VLDLKLVRERPEALREALARRGALDALAPELDRLDQLERDRRALIQQVEERKAARNAGAQEVARRKRAGESADDLIARGRALGDEIAALDARLAAAEGGLHDLLLGLPNVTLADVPAGGEECNAVVRAWGEPRAAGDAAPHWDVGARLGVFDLERAAKVSGRASRCTAGAAPGSCAPSSTTSSTRTSPSTATRRCGRRRSSRARR
jgi:seryl-tRNA synthetase